MPTIAVNRWLSGLILTHSANQFNRSFLLKVTLLNSDSQLGLWGMLTAVVELGKVAKYCVIKFEIIRSVCFYARTAPKVFIRWKKSLDCSETAVTDDPSSKVWFAPPGHEPLLPVVGSKQSTHWTSETVYWSEIVGFPQRSPPPPATWPGLWPVTVLRGGGGPARSRMEPGKACVITAGYSHNWRKA